MNRKVAIVAVIFALAVFVRLNSAPYTPPQVEEAEAAHHLTRVDKAAAAFVGAVRSVTGNRATFEPIHVWAMVDGTQCMQFRSQNRFGEMTVQSVVMPAGATRIWADGDSGFDSRWYSLCADKPGEDVTASVERHLR
ncbi:MAG TPA: hypothetical protein VFX54_01530 [Candidatus Binatia bacterium]|nr:hypothetical protein [Candidatus Binatia bacterium]